jgi:NitT/TauT family transport system permease protein
MMKRIWPPLFVLAVVVCAWEVAVRVFEPPAYLLCPPSEIVSVSIAKGGELLRATAITALSVALGLGLSLAAGILFGVSLARSRFLERAFYPFTVLLQTVPLVAIAPMLVLWLDAGLRAVVMCAFIVSLFPVITNTLIGIRSIPQPQVELFRLYGASSWARLKKLELPGAIPSLLAGARVAAGLAVIGAVVGEFVAGDLGAQRGLGILVVTAARQGEVALLFAAVFSASLLGVVAVGAVTLVEYGLLRRWHVSQRG